MSKVHCVLLMSSLFCLLGCGGGGRETGIPVVPPPPAAKATLEDIAESGRLQGKEQQLQDELMAFAEAEPELGAELLADYEQLTSQSGASEIKAKAAQMAEKL